MKRILAALIISVSVFSVAFALTNAYFSDSESSENNTFTAGALDLLVESVCHYWQNGQDVGCGEGPSFGNWEMGDLGEMFKFFNFDDIKPSDFGENTIGLTVNTNDAWVCSSVTLTSSQENGFTEPETLVDNLANGNFDGELDQELQFLIWPDDGDNVLEINESTSSALVQKSAQDLVGDDLAFTTALADSQVNIWDDNGPVPGTQTRYLGSAWCFGEFILSPLPQANNYNAAINPGFSCDGSLKTNISQTDILTGNISFTAVQARNNPEFLCSDEQDCSSEGSVSPNQSMTYTQGLQKGGSPVLPERSNPDSALGTPEGTKLPGTFFSLGFGGVVTYKFSYAIEDIPGTDLSFYEVTNLPYPTEQASIAVSQDGVTFVNIGTVGNSGDQIDDLDINGVFPWIKYIKVTDTTNPALHNDAADGYDLDGIVAHNFNTCL